MEKTDLINQLHAYKLEKRNEYQLKKIGLFGSFARDDAGNDSDIDIVVELHRPDLFILGNIKTDLEELFGKRVYIVRLREKMNKFLKKRIEEEAIYV